MSDFNVELFKGTTFSTLMQDIYKNSSKKERQLNLLIAELKPLINNNLANATMIVPLIREYLDLSVKNDEILVKLAAVVQRAIASQTKPGMESDNTGFGGLTDAERDQLLKEVEALQKTGAEIDKSIETVTT
jgi:hypothetical protein